jgi:hypothetical protein
MAIDNLCCAKSCAKRSRYGAAQRGHWPRSHEVDRGDRSDDEECRDSSKDLAPEGFHAEREICLLYAELSLV